ncbi:hypothetical protein HYE68_010342 [Fusarium pseudograminearum]|nr:hypothetical protein HYE68_010342 [Fusarium pseudograminearum]
MNPITRRPGPGRGRPRKQPPVPVPGAPGEGAPHPPLALGIDHGPPPNSAPPYPQGAQSYDPTPAGYQPTHPQQVQAAMRPGSISSAPPTPQAPIPSNAVPGPGPATYPSSNLTPALPQNPPHLHPLQHGQPGQSGQPDADGDADGEVDVDSDEPSAKRQRMGSPEPAKDDDMDDEAVLALAAHSGPTDFASDFATYGEA